MSSLLCTSIFSYTHYFGKPQSFIRSNSACKISFNDESLNIMPAKSLMLFKELAILVVQQVVEQNLSFLSTTLSSFSRQRSPWSGIIFWFSGNQNSVTVWRYFSWQHTMSETNQTFQDILVFNYVLLHHLQTSAH